MGLRQAARFQLRLVSCLLAGVLAEFVAMPHILAWGLEMHNVVLAWILGVVLFLVLGTLAGLIWRRSIMARPRRWALAAPLALPLAIYILLRSLAGFASDEARMALETSFVAAVCALFSSAFFLMWTSLAPGTDSPEPSGATRK